FLSEGVLPSGGGGIVKPMGKTFCPLMTSTKSSLITARDGLAIASKQRRKAALKQKESGLIMFDFSLSGPIAHVNPTRHPASCWPIRAPCLFPCNLSLRIEQ